MFDFARRFTGLTLLSLGLAGLAGCGGTYQPSRSSSFELDSAAQIDDDDVRKAFDARPQLPSRLTVAYYTFDPVVANDVDATLRGLPGVTSVYRIPPLLVTGQRRFDNHDYYWGPPREVAIKKLRLLAARAHADVLVVIDHGLRTGGANPLAALDLLIVPIFFVPFLDNTVDGYAEAFVIDTRNGYLYGHITEDDKRGDEYATIYGKSQKVLAAEQWAALRSGLQKDLAKLVADEQSHAAPAPPRAVGAAVAPAPAAPAAPPVAP